MLGSDALAWLFVSGYRAKAQATKPAAVAAAVLAQPAAAAAKVEPWADIEDFELPLLPGLGPEAFTFEIKACKLAHGLKKPAPEAAVGPALLQCPEELAATPRQLPPTLSERRVRISQRGFRLWPLPLKRCFVDEAEFALDPQMMG